VSTILGGVEAFPDASPTDGRLDVGVARTRSRSDWLRLLAGAVVRRPGASALAEVVSAERLTIELDRTLPWQVDGSDRDRTDTFEVTCLPGAIRICQPWQSQQGAPS
jgi:diacylglycerol kinase (ATP)